ncbi:hypothetical protein ACCD03_25625, partial [Ralstonia sp. Ralssp135]
AGVHEGKNEINARVGYFKLGINLKTETPTPQAVKKAIDEVLNNDEYKWAVKHLSSEFRNYDALSLCEKYVKQLLYGEHTH